MRGVPVIIIGFVLLLFMGGLAIYRIKNRDLNNEKEPGRWSGVNNDSVKLSENSLPGILMAVIGTIGSIGFIIVGFVTL